jgi:hypothetical protein
MKNLTEGGAIKEGAAIKEGLRRWPGNRNWCVAAHTKSMYLFFFLAAPMLSVFALGY